MFYTLKVKKLIGTISRTTSESSSSDPAVVLKQLAICFREANKDTRKNEKITRAKFWPAMDLHGDEIQRFRFFIKYDELNEYIYIYEFVGCGLN